MTLTVDEMERLKTALLGAFPNPADYRPIVLFSTGQSLASIVNPNQKLSAVVDELIEWLNANEATVEPFLTKARQTNAGNAALRDFVKSYKDARSPTAGGANAALNPSLRSDLVSALAAMPSLQDRAARDALVAPAQAAGATRDDLDARRDIELLADQLPQPALADIAERAATTADAFNAALAGRLRSVATALGKKFAQPTPAAPMQAEPPVRPEALLFEGVDERQSRAFLVSAVEVGRSVARIAVARHFGGAPAGGEPAKGTGWLIAPTLMMTNHHVIEARDHRFEPDASAADFTAQGGAVTVWFDYFEEDGAGRITANSTGVVASDRKLDFAIFRLDQVPGRADRPLKLLSTRPPMQLSARLNIVQHGGGRPQRYAIRNNFYVEEKEEKLRYLTDTEEGASGSPVLNDAWRVVALHHAAKPIQPKEIATLDLASRKVIQFYNEGIFIDAILTWLKTNAPAVHQEINGD